MNSETIGATGKASSKGGLAAALSAVGSVLAASTCCLPVLPFVLAAGTAGSARFLSSFNGAPRGPVLRNVHGKTASFQAPIEDVARVLLAGLTGAAVFAHARAAAQAKRAQNGGPEVGRLALEPAQDI